MVKGIFPIRFSKGFESLSSWGKRSLDKRVVEVDGYVRHFRHLLNHRHDIVHEPSLLAELIAHNPQCLKNRWIFGEYDKRLIQSDEWFAVRLDRGSRILRQDIAIAKRIGAARLSL